MPCGAGDPDPLISRFKSPLGHPPRPLSTRNVAAARTRFPLKWCTNGARRERRLPGSMRRSARMVARPTTCGGDSGRQPRGPHPPRSTRCWMGRGEESARSARHTGVMDRDRDASGRPRNARPRDGLGRPLLYGAAGVARQSEGVVRTPEQTLQEAQRLLDAGRPFHAHEVFEDAWKAARDAPEASLWKALAQLAVGCTHRLRGNAVGAQRLLHRAAAGLGRVAKPV